MGPDEGDWATVEYDASLDAVVGTTHEYADGDQFRTVLDAIIDEVQEHDTGCILADTRELGPIDQGDQEWLVGDWSPRAAAAGLDRIAFVVPESVTANMALDSVAESADDDVERRFFEALGPARSWLGDA